MEEMKRREEKGARERGGYWMLLEYEVDIIQYQLHYGRLAMDKTSHVLSY